MAYLNGGGQGGIPPSSSWGLRPHAEKGALFYEASVFLVAVSQCWVKWQTDSNIQNYTNIQDENYFTLWSVLFRKT